MRRWLWLGLVAGAAIAAAITIVALPRGPEWTTSSPAALAEFELALQAQMKLYHTDAIVHLKKAVELDPDFVMARLMLADYAKWDKSIDADELLEKVQTADVTSLRPRERCYVERLRAIRDKRPEDAERSLTEYRERYPNDPFALATEASHAFQRGDNENAEKLYRRLIEVGPNWVIAYNQLGYISMLQGRFAEAEEHFTSYRFIAPDQANPHDSLGELYVIQGRLPEAGQSFETAITIKPDFWDSYGHLAFTRALLGDYAGAAEAAAAPTSVPNCPAELTQELSCMATCLELERSGRWRDVLDLQSSPCLSDVNPSEICPRVEHRAACQLGEWQLAQDIEARAKTYLDQARTQGETMSHDEGMAPLLHMQGVRLALSGDLAGAEKAVAEVDANLVYYNSYVGMGKLFNRLLLVETLLAEGRTADAHQLLAKVRAVNPWLVAGFEESGLQMMGLPRR
jgi:tetratricopeptide (TPR) repeat protein